MDGVSELLKQGVFGLVSAIFLGLYLSERRENKELYKQLYEQSDARRQDAKDTADKVVAPLNSISQTVSYIYDKLVVSKKNGD